MEIKYKYVEKTNLLKVTFFGNKCDIPLGFFDKKNTCYKLGSVYKSINYFSIFVNEKKFYFFTKKGNLYLSSKFSNVIKRGSYFFSFISKKNIYLVGYLTNVGNKLDNVYLNDKKILKVKRLFNRTYLKHFALIKLNLNEIFNISDLHLSIYVGDDDNNVSYIRTKSFINKYDPKIISSRMIDDLFIIVRNHGSMSGLCITKIKNSAEYKLINKIKNLISFYIYKIIGQKNIILMFEKESRRAQESGYYIFTKLMKEKNMKSKVYFIIDELSEDYKKIKKEYPNNVVEKYSFKHYLYMYLSKYFISSELPNHVLNTRFYIKHLKKVIEEKPLIFLQHGIMFAKPVDNPAAQGFYKNNCQYNIYKNVISSDLEATQFYKMGYDDNDLIKCGLTKFDISKSIKTGDKIMVMLTYRYWEEAFVLDSKKIKQTSYYRTYMDIINAFEKNNMLDRLLLSCHPKFADCLIKSAPKYKSIIENNIDRGLQQSKIFITDYSSASYDAHYRGAYIIYYWAEKDYLISNYKAIPPINESNCDGIPVYSCDELILEVKRAIEKKYKMDDVYNKRYKKINEFSDNKNGERLIKELKKLGII